LGNQGFEDLLGVHVQSGGGLEAEGFGGGVMLVLVKRERDLGTLSGLDSWGHNGLIA
jgi:hypothetical protein